MNATQPRDTIARQRGNYTQSNPNMQNYAYDKIGNLISDKQEEIAEIKWNVQGKVQEIKRTANSLKPDLLFKYDAIGNRLSKTIKYKNPNPEGTVTEELTTYYVRDAQGTVMAVYEIEKKSTYDRYNVTGTDEDMYLKEQHIYGSSRLSDPLRRRRLCAFSAPL